MAALAKSAPWLFGKYVAWLTNPVIGGILGYIIQFFVKQTALGLSLAWISVDVQYDVKSAEEAIAKLKRILADPAAYTAKQIEETEAQFDQEVVKLIRIKLALPLP